MNPQNGGVKNNNTWGGMIESCIHHERAKKDSSGKGGGSRVLEEAKTVPRGLTVVTGRKWSRKSGPPNAEKKRGEKKDFSKRRRNR